jgi:hypothetical protein
MRTFSSVIILNDHSPLNGKLGIVAFSLVGFEMEELLLIFILNHIRVMITAPGMLAVLACVEEYFPTFWQMLQLSPSGRMTPLHVVSLSGGSYRDRFGTRRCAAG